MEQQLQLYMRDHTPRTFDQAGVQLMQEVCIITPWLLFPA